MPRSPKGEKRPADVIGNAVRVMRIATGKIEDTGRDSAKELHRKGGLKGGKAGAASLSSVSKTLWEIGDIVKLVEAAEAKPAKRLSYEKRMAA